MKQGRNTAGTLTITGGDTARTGRYVSQAEKAAVRAEQSAAVAEAWAVGEKGGAPVGSTDETFHNNARHFAEQAAASVTFAQAARTAAESAKDAAEAAADSVTGSAAQIQSNKQDVHDLKSALNTKAGILRDTARGSVALFVPDATVPNLLGLSVALKPIQDLHGYDSPWPAGGGKNLLDGTLLVDQETWNIIDIPFAQGTVLTMSTNKGTVDSTGGMYLYFRQGDDETTDASSAVYDNHPVTLTVNSSGKVQIVQRNRDMIQSFADYWYQLELGSTATSYAPFENLCPISGHDSVTVNANGNTHTFSLPETVYGGDVGVVSGDGDSNMAMVDMGTLKWTYVASDAVFYSAIADKAAGEANLRCSCYKTGGNTGYSTPNFTVGYSTSSGLLKRVFIGDPNYSNAADFKAAVTGQTLVYRLATPTPISTTPTEISTVEGQNNVFSPDGDVTVEYAADLKTYIDSKIAATVAALS